MAESEAAKALKLLVDECLSPRLVEAAHNRGIEAYHVLHRGWSGFPDHAILREALKGGYVIVTSNRVDFVALISAASVHPGLIIFLDNATRDGQQKMLLTALELCLTLPSMSDKVLEVDLAGRLRLYDLGGE